MSHSKKHHIRYCHEHPKLPISGKCTICKAWICRECGEKNDHVWKCFSCATKKDLLPLIIPQKVSDILVESITICKAAPEKPFDDFVQTIPFRSPMYKPASPNKSQQQTPLPQSRPINFLVVLACVTLMLCGILFALFTLRNNAELTNQNQILKEKRLELLDQIKQRNQEILSLRFLIDNKNATSDSAVVIKNTEPVLHQNLVAPLPTISGLPLTFDNGSSKKKSIALTFDGGSFVNAAADILDTLKSRNIKVTMFLTGKFMKTYPDVVRRIVADGHEVGNHSFSHPHLTSYAQDHTQTLLSTITAASLSVELAKTDSIYFGITGTHLPHIWRTPYGEFNRVLGAWGQQAGYLHIGWRQGKNWRESLDSNDWTQDEETPGFHTPEQVYEKIVSLANEANGGIKGGIILMHLGTVRVQKEKQVHLILGRLIDTLESMGYTIVPVSELIRDSGIDISLLDHKNKVF